MTSSTSAVLKVVDIVSIMPAEHQHVSIAIVRMLGTVLLSVRPHRAASMVVDSHTGYRVNGVYVKCLLFLPTPNIP